MIGHWSFMKGCMIFLTSLCKYYIWIYTVWYSLLSSGPSTRNDNIEITAFNIIDFWYIIKLVEKKFFFGNFSQEFMKFMIPISFISEMDLLQICYKPQGLTKQLLELVTIFQNLLTRQWEFSLIYQICNNNIKISIEITTHLYNPKNPGNWLNGDNWT